MRLTSNLFKDSRRLQSTLIADSAHVVPGEAGEHVERIQVAVMDLIDATIAQGELAARRYGPSTAAAVLAFKRARRIINHAYQSTADNIVGKMTIAALDKEMLDKQERTLPRPRGRCFHK
jgi:peptidoglycan hydrolase-like protein with peptidoglycan-binding domain